VQARGELPLKNADVKEVGMDARKLHATICSMRLTAKPRVAEIANLREWKHKALIENRTSASRKDEMTQQIYELTLWKEEALLTMKRGNREKLASAQMIDDLENDLKRYWNKYQDSMKALALMEEALLVRVCDCLVEAQFLVGIVLF